MRTPFALLIVGLLIVFILAFVGLGVGFFLSQQKAAPPPAGAPTATPSRPGPTPTGAPVTAPRDELRLLGSDPPTLDPALAGDATSATYIVEVFSGLVTLDRNLAIVPDIAESWKVSPDGLTYAFTLRKDVKFHNGKPVTAQDFKYSIERATDPKLASVVADTYLGDIVGAKDKLRKKATEVSGVKVIDDYTLEVRIDSPKTYFLAKLTYPTAFVLDKENVESGRLWFTKPNGTGPFKLKEWRIGERLILERNPSYYRGPAKLKTVRFILSGGSSVTMYESNEIDISGVGLTDIDRVLDPANPLNKELVSGTELSIGYIGFNVTMPPFDDPKVRQALNYAVDKKKIASVVLKDLVEPAYGIVPPGMPSYTNPGLNGLDFDPEKAKALIAESKYKSVQDLPRITLTMSGTGAAIPPASEAVIEMWRVNLGLEVEIRQAEWATFLEDLKRHNFQAFEVGWIADYADPQNFLDILFHSQSLENNAQYSNPEVDRLLEEARVERDEGKRLRLYQQAEQAIVNDAPWLPLWYSKFYMLVKPYVKGFDQPPLVRPFLKEVYFQQ